MTVKEIIDKYKLSPKEAEGLEKMISMMMCLKKYENLSRLKS